MLTIRQLEAFRAVMLTRSMTEAARILSVTQPAVSKILHELEREVGFPLFLRTKGGLKPSEEALAFFREVDRTFVGLERLSRSAERIRRRQGGRLRVAAMPALTGGFLQRVVHELSETGHNPSVSIHTYNSPEVVDMVGAGHADLGFAMTPVVSDRVIVGPVMNAHCICLLPSGHRLAEKKRLELTDFEGEPFVSLAESTTTRLLIDAAFQAANVSRSLALEARWSFAVGCFVAEGLGVTIIEPFTAQVFKSLGVVLRPLAEKIDFSFTYLLPKSASQNPLSELFLDRVLDHLERINEERY